MIDDKSREFLTELIDINKPKGNILVLKKKIINLNSISTDISQMQLLKLSNIKVNRLQIDNLLYQEKLIEIKNNNIEYYPYLVNNYLREN